MASPIYKKRMVGVVLCGSGTQVTTLAVATLVSNGMVIDELETFWKEAVVT
jgi:hypothetical protein